MRVVVATGRADAVAPLVVRGRGGRTAFLGAMGLGLLAAALFSSSFVVNKSMQLGGGAWEWTASLRYLMLLPLLAAIVGARRGLAPVLAALRAEPARWLLWSTIGFGLFYAPLAFAVSAGPGWLLAGTWQLTILAGILLAPVLYDDERAVIPRRAVAGALIVLAGVALMQAEHASGVGTDVLLVGVLPVIVAAFAYPAGNRRTMELADGRLDVWQRILAMVIASLPFWIVLSAVGAAHAGPPGAAQLGQSLVVAVIGGLVATALFFAATARVRRDPTRLAAVEATQSGEVVFAAGLEAVLLGAGLPSPVAWLGIALIVAGIGSTVLRDR
jgi:drug/metabolite transporter (DMT)-like permease